MQITNSLCVVSGASSGIGRATALELAKCGAKVILFARNKEKLEATLQEIQRQGGQAWAYPTDLSNPEQVETTAQQILTTHGVPHILVHSAGAGAWRFIRPLS